MKSLAATARTGLTDVAERIGSRVVLAPIRSPVAPARMCFEFNRVADSSTTNGIDQITDFESGDKIDLSGIDADFTIFGNQAFQLIGMAAFSGTAGELRVHEASGDSTLEGDVDGDGAADFTLLLASYQGLVEDDLIL